MFAKTIIDSDAFIDMPLSAQALYFHLSMRGDDEGFINNPRKIQRMIGASDDDLKLLILKNFIIPFESGIVVIKHWKIHNYIRRDRITPTVYTEERAQIAEKDNGAYTCRANVSQVSVTCQPSVSQMSDNCLPNVSIGKDSIDKDRIDKKEKSARFIPPTREDVIDYCIAANITIDADAFIDYYTSNGWKVGSHKLKDWQATVRNWSRRDKERAKEKKENRLGTFGDYKQTTTDDEWDDFGKAASRGCDH